ncbi:hypothetical protein HN011_012216 [Eciton burchellii]|jgi:NAD(P)-dependent dehydrogenase (short-subunit alcohol dehydrogenase family)|nr:hypothetical protein HN011_012216 [Eciton burchellii]
MGKHKRGKGGVIVNIASILGLATFGGVPVYRAYTSLDLVSPWQSCDSAEIRVGIIYLGDDDDDNEY